MLTEIKKKSQLAKVTFYGQFPTERGKKTLSKKSSQFYSQLPTEQSGKLSAGNVHWSTSKCRLIGGPPLSAYSKYSNGTEGNHSRMGGGRRREGRWGGGAEERGKVRGEGIK